MANDTLHSVLKNHPLLIVKVKRSMMPENASKGSQFKVQHNSSAIFWTFQKCLQKLQNNVRLHHKPPVFSSCSLKRGFAASFFFTRKK